MNFKKSIFILSIFGILLLIFLTQTTGQTQIGTIKSIQTFDDKTTITLENNSAELILFNTPYINLSKGDIIKFQGKKDIYKNKEQIIISKLICYN